MEGAIRGGAGRIELCSDLAVGGVTPDEALIVEALSACRGAEVGPQVQLVCSGTGEESPEVQSACCGTEAGPQAQLACRGAEVGPQVQLVCSGTGEVGPEAQEVLSGGVAVNVLVRPRAGDFVYSEDEVRLMMEQICTCKRLGVNGVVIGALTREGDIDLPLMRRLVDAARPLDVTFHRAFDECRNPAVALEDVISLGCERLLTSGCAPSAEEGKELLAQLMRQAARRIIIMPGAGIKPGNAAAIAAAVQTTEYHGSAHGASGFTDSETVKQIRTSLQSVISG
ncbi:MAG: copper homeostasis protein CutC [Bacteroidales bacterium]|nr:copper homeostasis protein CutC [Bacteroidales bacterium]